MKTLLKTGLAAATLAATMTATPALAQDSEAAPTAIVEYSDLDLSTEQGQDALHSRLRRAARYVCGMDIRVPGSGLASSESRACYAEKLRTFEREVAVAIGNEARRG